MEPQSDPLGLFERWFRDAVAAGSPQPDAMALATADPAGRPSVRFVLLKRWDERGFVFFSDSRSRKGREAAANPFAALALHWFEIHRQVRAAGSLEEVERSEVLAYWRSRPRESQAAAAASEQSAPLESRGALLKEFERQLASHPQAVPLPDAWTGYRLRPDYVEFWEGRPNRLHDRLLYRRRDGGWEIERLAP